jgi:outer membrane protein insertion porin family
MPLLCKKVGLLLCALAWGGLYHTQAQTATSVVNVVLFEGEPLYPAPQLQSYLRTQGNRRFFDLANVTPWLWIYEWGEKSRLPKRIKTAILNSGDPPAFLENSAIQTDTTRLKIFYQQQGYRWAKVCPEIRALDATSAYIDSIRTTIFNLQNGLKAVKCQVPPPNQAPKVNVVFHVFLGQRLYVRAYRYEGLNQLSAEDRLQCVSPSLLNTTGSQSLNFSFLANPNSPYDEALLYAERRRLVNCLQNKGYAQMSRDSVLAIAYTKSDSLEIALQAQTGKKYKLGNIQFMVEGQDELPFFKRDTLWQKDGYSITTIRKNEPILAPEYPQELLSIYPGTWFNQAQLLATKNALDQTGLFSFTTFEPRFDLQYQENGYWVLPVTFSLNTQKRLNFSTNASVLQGTGSNTLTGIQTGFSIANTNTRGKGEQLKFDVSGAIAFNLPSFFRSDATADDRFPHRQIEAGVTWAFPYLKRNLFELAKRAKIPTQNLRTELSLNTLFAQQLNYYSIIRPRINFRYGVAISHAATRFSRIDLLDLYVNNVNITNVARFQTDVLDQILDPRLRQQTLEDFSSARINNAFRYVYRHQTANLLKRDKGIIRELSAEMGGNIFTLLDRFVFSPESIGGKLGKSFVYSQYARLSADLRRYHALKDKNVLATRFFAGWAYPFRDSLTIPFDRRFFIGGSTSLRAWDEDNLGVVALGASKAPLGAPIKQELSVEWRRTVIQRFFGASWIVVPFVDAGATWYGKHTPRDASTQSALFRFDRFYKQYTVSHGAGLRIAWDYLILGFDWAWRIRYRDIANENSSTPSEGLWKWNAPLGWNGSRLFGNNSRFHLVIGHTF